MTETLPLTRERIIFDAVYSVLEKSGYHHVLSGQCGACLSLPKRHLHTPGFARDLYLSVIRALHADGAYNPKIDEYPLLEASTS